MALERSHLIKSIGKVRKNDDAAIEVSVKEFKGKRYADIRHVFIDHAGRSIPKTGITIGKKGLPVLIEYLQECERLLSLRDGIDAT